MMFIRFVSLDALATFWIVIKMTAYTLVVVKFHSSIVRFSTLLDNKEEIMASVVPAVIWYCIIGEMLNQVSVT